MADAVPVSRLPTDVSSSQQPSLTLAIRSAQRAYLIQFDQVHLQVLALFAFHHELEPPDARRWFSNHKVHVPCTQFGRAKQITEQFTSVRSYESARLSSQHLAAHCRHEDDVSVCQARAHALHMT